MFGVQACMLQIDHQCCEQGALSAVARERDVAVSQISRAMSQLEARYGVSLLRRTTHGLSLTGEGEVFLGYCRASRRRLMNSTANFHHARATCDIVRVAVSANMAQHVIVPSLPELVARHPA